MSKHDALHICPCGTYVYEKPKNPPVECQWPEFPDNLCSNCLRDWRLANLEYELARIKDFGKYA